MRRTAAFATVLLAAITLTFLAGRYSTRDKAAETPTARRVLYWVDPMHPAYKSDKPGIAPDCGMNLEPVYAGDTAARVADTSNAPGAVQINLEQQQLIGLSVAPVETTSGTRDVRLSGRVAADEERTYRVVSGTDGFIEKTLRETTGSLVKKDEVLATFVSPEFLTAQQNYLSGAFRPPETRNETFNEGDWRFQIGKLARTKLRALGMSDAQIKHISDTHLVAESIDIVSPVDGFIVARSVSPGQRFEKGLEFYRITDLSRVWILADVFENEAGYFRPGTVATVNLPQQKKKFRARVSDVAPQFDPTTRTLKIRLIADNPGFALRPDMFVDIELPTRMPPGLSVPVDALLDSGLKKHVFIDRGGGFFEPREVETGWRLGDRIQIVSGLKEGDRVVNSGTFLMDSESRLKAVAASTERIPAMKEEPGHSHAETKMNHAASVPTHSVKDPACGMDIDPAAAGANTASYRGTTYYFCSSTCRSKFEKEPARYLTSSHEGMQRD